MNRNGHNGATTKNSNISTSVVIGMSDGLIVPFALAAGLSGVVDSNATIVTAGMAGIAIGAIVMSWGGYLAGKTSLGHPAKETKREYPVAGNVPGIEKQEAKTFFANIGLSEEMQVRAAEEMSNDEKQWSELIMKYELSPGKPGSGGALKSALTIGLSYAVGGLVPLSPYFFVATPVEGLKVSAVLTLFCLLVFGYFKSRITGVNPFWGAIRASLTGALAAGGAFGIAKLFEL